MAHEVLTFEEYNRIGGGTPARAAAAHRLRERGDSRAAEPVSRCEDVRYSIRLVGWDAAGLRRALDDTGFDGRGPSGITAWVFATGAQLSELAGREEVRGTIMEIPATLH